MEIKYLTRLCSEVRYELCKPGGLQSSLIVKGGVALQRRYTDKPYEQSEISTYRGMRNNSEMKRLSRSLGCEQRETLLFIVWDTLVPHMMQWSTSVV